MGSIQRRADVPGRPSERRRLGTHRLWTASLRAATVLAWSSVHRHTPRSAGRSAIYGPSSRFRRRSSPTAAACTGPISAASSAVSAIRRTPTSSGSPSRSTSQALPCWRPPNATRAESLGPMDRGRSSRRRRAATRQRAYSQRFLSDLHRFIGGGDRIAPAESDLWRFGTWERV